MIEAGKIYKFYGDQAVKVHKVTGTTYEDGQYVEVVATYIKKNGKDGQTGVRAIPSDAQEVTGRD